MLLYSHSLFLFVQFFHVSNSHCNEDEDDQTVLDSGNEDILFLECIAKFRRWWRKHNNVLTLLKHKLRIKLIC